MSKKFLVGLFPVLNKYARFNKLVSRWLSGGSKQYAVCLPITIGMGTASCLLFLLIFLPTLAKCIVLNDSTLHSSPKIAPSTTVTRTFSQLPATQASVNDPINIPAYILADSVAAERAKAMEAHQRVMEKNAFVSNLAEAAFMELPVGIASADNNPSYAIILSKIEVNDRGTYVDAYLMFELPNTGDKIAFRGKNIEFTYDGGFTGSGRLELVGTYPIKLSNHALLSLVGTRGNTFVDFDCNGFKGMGIEAELEFSRDIIIPEDEKGKPLPGNERVRTRFTTYAQSWNDLLVGVNLPPFQIAGLNGFGFSVLEAYLDWSDVANPSGIVFPPGYTSPFSSSEASAQEDPSLNGGDLSSLWQGIYMQRLQVRLSPSFKKSNDSTRRVSVGVERMLLDDRGFSGNVFVENIIEAGDMSGWAYTLDKLAVEVVLNDVKGFELAGKLTIPVVKNKEGQPTRFGYRAQRDAAGNYQFAVKVDDQLKLPVLIADLTLYQGSTVSVVEKNDRFYPTAILNGHLGIKGTANGPKPELAGIRFEGLRISALEPKFDIQALGFGREGQQQQVSKFPVAINNILIKKEKDRLGLGFDLIVNIGGSSAEEGFGGTAGLVVWGQRKTKDLKNAEGQVIGTDRYGWEFDKVELSAVGISVKKPGVFDIAGTVRFFDSDPTYGEGFSGEIKGALSKIQTKFTLFALFGKKDTYRYWYADALVEFTPGVPIIPGILEANGFGGGYYHRMKQGAQPASGVIGKAPSGITYIPDENARGIRAMMMIATPRPELMNGLVSLEVAMNRSGGINSVTFAGNAKFLSFEQIAKAKMKELAGDAASGKVAGKLATMLGGQMYANMKMHFDNENDVFHGTMEAYINVAGGLVRGVSQGNKAGWAVIHFERAYWQVLIGTPDQPLGIEVARLFKSKSYFMAGKNIPGSPPPPSQVIEILGGKDLDYMRDMNALQSGMGVAFGLSFIVDTGNLRFLMFYGRFAAGAGADLMLKDYGDGYHCAGSSGPFGINGWYANGQVYAFVQGKIGVRVNLRFYKGNYDILSIGAAAILQGKGPNPFWMKGVVGGHFRILGGLVKGKCRFEVTVGQDCKPVGEQDLLADVNMIAEISPAKDSKEVDVFTTPQVAFNIPVGEIFEITDLENKTHYFRAMLDEFSVKNGAEILTGELTWNADNDVVVFDGRDILPGEKKLDAYARLTFEERVNGVWKKVTFQGKVVEEIAKTTFETGTAPDFIPPNNVLVSYPLAGMVNFYPKEYNRGFIQLKDGQPYLFNLGPEWIQKARMTSGNGYVETDFAYNSSTRRVDFTMPAGFGNAKVYQFEILNLPRQNTVIDANVQKVQTELAPSSDGGSTTLTTKNIEGNLEKLEAKSIYSSTFRTSKYNTFVEKMRGVTLTQSVRVDLGRFAFVLASYVKGDEAFDNFEVIGKEGTPKLVQMEAVTVNNQWFAKHLNPMLYDGYPYNGWTVARPNPEKLGVPPVRDIYVGNQLSTLGFKRNDNALVAYPFTSEYIIYNLGESVDQDYNSIKQQAANFVVDSPQRINDRVGYILLSRPPFIKYGEYKIKLSYKIPGIENATSSYEWLMFNTIPDFDN
jgi:hypothetical protein